MQNVVGHFVPWTKRKLSGDLVKINVLRQHIYKTKTHRGKVLKAYIKVKV